jgi:photosystem II stability/assembly factor-like uncharacterized protein
VARTKTARKKTRSKASRPTARPRPKPEATPRRPRPKSRRTGSWAWIGVAAASAVALAAFFLIRGGGGGESSPARPFVGGDLHSLVVDSERPSRLFVGGHHGVAFSTDGGKTWRPVDSLEGADAMGWAFSGERVLVGGHPGLFVSENGGRSFEHRNDGLLATDIHALGTAGEVIYAASPQLGVFASLDGARTWEVRTQDVGHSFMGRILVDPKDPDHVVAPDMSAGAVESTDGGRTWRALGGAPGAMWVSWDPDDTRHIVVSGIDQAAVTTDGGTSWRSLDIPDGASLVEMDPVSPETLYAGVHEGDAAVVWVSRDGGRTWTRP